MTPLLFLSCGGLSALALVSSARLWRRHRDARLAAVIALVACAGLPALLHVAHRSDATVTQLAVTLGLGVTSVAAVVALRRLYDDHRSLRLKSAYFERLFDESPEGVVLLDNDDHVLRVNAGFSRMFEYAREEVVGRRINDLIVPEDRKSEGLRLTHTVAEGGSVHLDTVRRTKSGGRVHASILARPIAIDGGQVAVYGIYRDLSARRHAEHALRESEEKSQAILDTVQEGYYELDLGGRFTAVNGALCDLLACGAHDLVGTDYAGFADEPNAKKLETVLKWVRCRRTSAGVVEWSFLTRSGDTRHVEGSISPILDADNGMAGFRGIVRDVTERRLAEVVMRRQWAAIEASMDGMAILDEAGRFQYVNDALVALYGYASPAELLGKTWEMLYDEAERRRLRDEILPAVGVGHWRGECLGTRRDGSSFAQEMSLSRLGDGGLTVVVRDVTERRNAERALRTSEERYALAAKGANDGLWDWDLRTGTIYYSDRWKGMLGYADEEIGTSPEEWFGRVHPDDIDVLRANLASHLDGASPCFESEHRVRHRDGPYRWMLSRGLALADEDGVVFRMAGSQADITERKHAEQRLQHDAFHDALTGLPNRALVVDRLDHALNRLKRRGRHPFAVLFLDLDRFKIINDSLDHTFGDQMLISMARRVRSCVRPEDSVARVGGDEFVVLLDSVVDAGEATAIAERIQEAVSRPLRLANRDICTTVSIGIAMSGPGYDSAADVLRDAELAMYRAKSMGTARHEVFDTAMHQGMIERLELESDLRRALELNQFTLRYQPIIALEDGRLVGFEALLRWHHPKRGAVSPAVFIPIAEENGLIVPIGKWVLQQACRQMQAWCASPALAETTASVHVNLSGRQFRQVDLVEQVERVLAETGLHPRRLGLEITESVVMDDAMSATEMLKQLQALEIGLQIDDFGTGYSSLSYLHRFPVDTLKIDRSFVTKMGTEGRNAEIVRSIVALARELGVEVIAEGVETADQLAQLRSFGCHNGQGYFICKPLDPRTTDVPARAMECSRAAAPDPLPR